MKNSLITRCVSGLALCAVAGTAVLAQQATATRAKMDEPVKEFRLKDAMSDRGTLVSTGQGKGKKTTVLFFMSGKCPVTWQYEKRVGDMMKRYGKDVTFIGIKSHAGESAEEIRKFAEARNFDMPVLLDERNEVSRYFNIRVNPTFVVIDKRGVLRYVGAFDDNANEKAVSKKHLQEATLAVLNGRDVPVKQTRVPG